MNSNLQAVFADVLGLEEGEVNEELTPETVELWDSLNHLRLITALEEEFGCKFSMAEIEDMMKSVGRVREVLERHTGAQ